ncbi:helix-turn-helix domain-containing protein [Cellulomonas composti]|uniref:HTH luxR-type domain-containing protein n=1 Tax=Cellulomonas composti TaxID=266130 RepID=A0A511J919_9CELL|nr:helix-turn-helix transcriptional regulator [Cellulomonas composti]GEL94482.1 hypothetical protein CCO02nite_11400 [Cellulomonas composti]
MGRDERVDAVLRSLVDRSDAVDAAARAAVVDAPAADRALADALAAVLLCWRGEFESGASLAAAALAAAADEETLGLARAARGLAVAGWPPAATEPGDPLADAWADGPMAAGPLAGPIQTLQAEAALACARIELAGDLHARVGPVTEVLGRADHPFLALAHCTGARIRVFAGDVSGAEPFVVRALADARTPEGLALATACAALTEGNADRRGEVRRRVLGLIDSGIRPTDTVTSGVYLLAAYAVIAQGDVETAVRLVLQAGGDADLGRLRVVDRVICLELLVRAAADERDLDAALAWQLRAAPLATHPIADSTVARIAARVALLAGDAEGSLAHAESAIELATRRHRAIEAGEGEILAARARLASRRGGAATRRLVDVVAVADDRGHLAVRAAAARELRRAGRRLPPERASGWSGLSPRERDVALLVAEGATNGEIAAHLFLSEHTVRVHVSRVLHAFGVATRSGVARALPSGRPAADLPALTARQWQVAERVAAGRSNAQIAADLGVGLSTVEKHVSAILRRWHLSSRTAVARLVLASGG